MNTPRANKLTGLLKDVVECQRQEKGDLFFTIQHGGGEFYLCTKQKRGECVVEVYFNLNKLSHIVCKYVELEMDPKTDYARFDTPVPDLAVFSCITWFGELHNHLRKFDDYSQRMRQVLREEGIRIMVPESFKVRKANF